MTDMIAPIQQFLVDAGWHDATLEKLSGDLSSRRYHRLRSPNGDTAILSHDPSQDSARKFVDIGNWLHSIGLSAPRVFHADLDAGLLLLEDFGDNKLTSMIERAPQKQAAMYDLATDVLLHIKAQPILPLAQPDARELVDATRLVDAWYPNAQPEALDALRSVLLEHLEGLCVHPPSVSLRDFHTDNAIWLPERRGLSCLGLLDFQDAFLAHPAYDLMSMLTDARIDVPHDVFEAALNRFSTASTTALDEVTHAVSVLGVQRNLRILGVFYRAARRDGKTHHLPALPRVRGHLARCLSHSTFASVVHLLDTALPSPEGVGQ